MVGSERTLVQERDGPKSVIVIQIFIDMETERYHKNWKCP